VSDETTALTTEAQRQDQLRKAAILRAVGLDKVPAEQRELALAIANRYDLDLMLKHLVLIEGRPYITRDALLWVAHRSGHFDGIVATEPVIKEFPNLGQCWFCEVTVWRNDMSHPFTYGGRYPVGGQNRKYGPEMAIKVGECMALRRAFNVSAATVEEKWEQDAEDAITVEPPQTLAQVVEQRVAQVRESPQPQTAPDALERPTVPVFGQSDITTPLDDDDVLEAVLEPDSPDVGQMPEPLFEEPATPESFTAKMEAAGAPKPPKGNGGRKAPVTPPNQIMPTMTQPPAEGSLDQCPAMSPFTDGARCRLHAGHKGAHRSSPNESWGPTLVD
jgi:hypothetical protein